MGIAVISGPGRADCEAALTSNEWTLADKVLYDLCERYPSHSASDEVIAKVWLIGRGYAAPIERGRSGAMSSERFYSAVVAPAVLHSSIDQYLAQVDLYRCCEDPSDAEVVLAIHATLMKAFHAASGRANRSLAAKYLHFHRPLFFPIFDSRASAAIRVMTSGRVQGDFPKGDSEYRAFVARFVALRHWILVNHDLIMTPRAIDRVLLAY